MAFCVFTLSETGRNKLGRVGAIFNLLLVMLGLTIVGMSMFIRARIQTKLHLLDNYSGDAFVYFLTVTGVIITLVHAVGVKIYLDLGFYASRYRWESLVRLFGLIIIVISIIALAAVIVVFTHQLTMKKYFQSGLKTAMDRYIRSLEIKKTIDEMQLELQCCGSKGPEDWFNITWIDNAYLDLKAPEVKTHLKDGAYKGPNVPFSCCSVKASRPCIHRNVTGAHAHYSWPKDSTLNSMGCAGALATEFGATTLSIAGYIVLATFILMVSSLVFLKLLATAIANTYPWGDPEGEAPTWLIEDCPVGMCNTETPEPPEDVPVVMPGAKAPVKKQPANDKDSKNQSHPDDIDTEEDEAVDVPLLRRASADRRQLRQQQQQQQQYAPSGNGSPYETEDAYDRGGNYERNGGYSHGTGYAKDYSNANRYEKQGYQTSPRAAEPSRKQVVKKKQAKFTSEEEDDTDNLVTDLTSEDEEGVTTSKGGTTTTQGDTDVSEGETSGGGGGGGGGGGDGGGSGKKDKKGEKDDKKKKGDKKGAEKDKKGKGKDGKDKKRDKSKDKKGKKGDKKKGKSKEKKKKGGSKTKKKKPKKKKKSKKRK